MNIWPTRTRGLVRTTHGCEEATCISKVLLKSDWRSFSSASFRYLSHLALPGSKGLVRSPFGVSSQTKVDRLCKVSRDDWLEWMDSDSWGLWLASGDIDDCDDRDQRVPGLPSGRRSGDSCESWEAPSAGFMHPSPPRIEARVLGSSRGRGGKWAVSNNRRGWRPWQLFPSQNILILTVDTEGS